MSDTPDQSQSRWQKGLRVFFWLSVIIFSLFITAAVWFGYQFNQSLKTVYDVKRYPEIIQRASSDQWQIFPTNIPAETQQAAFYFTPGFLQGGTFMQLRLKLPAESILAIQAELEQSDRQKVLPVDLPSTFRYTLPFDVKSDEQLSASDDEQALPPSFQVFLHDSDLQDIQKDWNHNHLFFTAVSTELNEVIYYGSSW